VTRGIAFALVLVLVLAGCGGDSEEETPSERPDTRAAEPEPEPEPDSPLEKAAQAAGCELQSTTASTRGHTENIEAPVDYDTNPPTTGKHFQIAAEEGFYKRAVPDTALVHSHEHGRVVLWFKPRLPGKVRAALLYVFTQDPYQMLLVPRSEMPFDIAATAWNAEPGPQGTGRLLGCSSFSPRALEALREFRDEHRGRGPEVIP